MNNVRFFVRPAADQPVATRMRLGDIWCASDTGTVSQVRKRGATQEWYTLSWGIDYARLIGVTATPGAGGSRTIDFTIALVQGVLGTGVSGALVELIVNVPATATATVTATTGTLLEAQQPGGGGGLLRILGITNASGALVIRVVASTGSGACTAYAQSDNAIPASGGTASVTSAYP